MSQTAEAQPRPTWSARIFKAAVLRVIFMRLLAVGFLALGLAEWSELLGALKFGQPDFFALTVQSQAIVLFFAVANLVAAVGLWLLATWGVVVWFAAGAARIIRHTVFAASFGWMPLATGAEILGVILFILLVVSEARAERLELARQRETRRNRARES